MSVVRESCWVQTAEGVDTQEVPPMKKYLLAFVILLVLIGVASAALNMTEINEKILQKRTLVQSPDGGMVISPYDAIFTPPVIKEVEKLKLEPSGITVDENSKTSVDISGGSMRFKDIESGIEINTKIKVNGELLEPLEIKSEGKDVVFSDARIKEKDLIGTIKDVLPGVPKDPDEVIPSIANFTYTYLPNKIKETIVLQEDAELSFPVVLPAGYKMIKMEGTEEWKVVSATTKNTMVGLRAAQPFGYDAAGRFIEMNYTWDGNELHLNYDRYAKVVNYTEALSTKSRNLVFDYYLIEYPLTIDPTWTADGDHYSTTVGNYTVLMWNSTGSTEWTVPDGVDNIGYLLVGAGGNGGTYLGGGAGAGGMVYEAGTYITPGTVLEVTVGSGATGGVKGGNSSLGLAVAIGGGHGGEEGTRTGQFGGSGGGGHGGTITTAGSYTVGQGYAGSAGYTVGSAQGAGGGGGGANSAGGAPTDDDGGNGGLGRQNNITGNNTYYSGGGGGTGWGGNGGLANGGWGSNASYGGGGNGAPLNGGGTHATYTNYYGGGGGGGNGLAECKGYQGIVFVRYENPEAGTPPTANFGYVTYEYGTEFFDTSTGNPTAWAWIFGDEGLGDPPYNWSNASSYEQNPDHTFAEGNYSVYLNASNAAGSSIKMRNITNEVYTPSNVTMSGSNPLYPQQISFSLVDKWGRALSGVAVTATMTSSSVSNTNWLTEMFQISSAASSIDDTILSDSSDSGGTFVFPMISSGRYRLTFTKPSEGINETRDVHPLLLNYVFVLGTTSTATPPAIEDDINVTLYVDPHINIPYTNYVTLKGYYLDNSDTTGDVVFYALDRNGSVEWWDAAYYDGYAFTSEYSVCNYKEHAYTFGIYGVSSKWGNSSKAMGITMKGNSTGGLASDLVKIGCNSWYCPDVDEGCGIEELS